MKKKLLLVVFVLILLSMKIPLTVFATAVRVNNKLVTDAAKKVYSSLQEAHDDDGNVKAGDTLLIEGTNVEYGQLQCSKRLIIIGSGYLLAQNPQNQANSLSAIVQSVHFNPGSEGSAVIGVVFSSKNTGYAPIIKTDNIAVIRCYLTNGININATVDNVVIIQNFLEKYGISVGNTNYSFGGFILKNNILASAISIEQYVGAPRIFTTVENNIFLANVKVSSNSFRNNIVVNASSTVNVTSGAIQNNLVRDGQLAVTNGNQVYDESTLFIGPTAANNSLDGQYKLKSDSPYLTAGFNGVQPGIFGGNEPYVISGIPAIPTIYDVQGDAVGSKQNGLNITIKARTNN